VPFGDRCADPEPIGAERSGELLRDEVAQPLAGDLEDQPKVSPW
jgi:hypothetical protein